MVDIESLVQSFLERHGLDSGAALVVGLSGGVDSLVLTAVLKRLHAAGKAPRPHALHVDHGFRTGSAGEARHVVELARSLDVQLEVRRVDISIWTSRLGGLEAAARAARYAELALAAERVGALAVAVAHNRNDQVETVLLRLLRGASLDGLAGMRPLAWRSVPLDPEAVCRRELLIARPLLEIERSAIEAYARRQELTPIDDPSNRDPWFRRNRVRHELLPLIERIAPGSLATISRTAGLLAEDAAFLNRMVDERAARAIRGGPELTLVDRQRVRELEPALRRRVLARAVYQVSSGWDQLSSERLAALERATVGERSSAVIELGGDLAARIDYDRVAIAGRESLDERLRAASRLPLLAPGSTIELRAGVVAQLSRGALSVARLDQPSGWSLRTRRAGDRLRTSDGKDVRLQDWLVNRKVPVYLRDWLPVLVGDEVVRWVVGLDEPHFLDSAAGIELHLIGSEGKGSAGDGACQDGAS